MSVREDRILELLASSAEPKTAGELCEMDASIGRSNRVGRCLRVLERYQMVERAEESRTNGYPVIKWRLI